jgi:hypothetical protein
VFENRVLRGIFGPKRVKITGVWRKLHNEELHDLYPSSNIVRVMKSRRMRWVGACSADGGGERRVLVFGGKTGGKRPLRKPKRRWEDNINIDLQKLGCRAWI